MGPWGDHPPKRPKVGSGRTALAKRAKARGGRERKASAEAARRGLSRRRPGARRRKDPGLLEPVRRGWSVLRQHSSHIRQRFLVQRRVRHLLVVIAAGWACWTFVLGDAGVPRLLSLRHQNGELEQELVRLDRERELLQSEVRSLRRGDAAAIERVAREEHALVRDGEVLVRFFEAEEE